MKRKSSRTSNRPSKRMRTFRRRPRLRRTLRNNIHWFKRTCQYTQLLTANTANVGVLGKLSFKLSDLPNYSEFASLFDQYTIRGIKLRIVPNYTSADANPLSSIVKAPNLHTCLDFDDDSLATGVTDLMEYPTYKMTQGHRIHARYFKPAVATMVYNTSTTSGYGQKKNVWLDCVNASIPHYGLLYYIDGINSTTQLAWQVYATFYCGFKGVR